MKNKLMLTALLGLLLVGSFSYAEESDDEAKKRLLKEYEKVQKEREKEAERAAKEAEEAAKRQAEEGTQSVQEIANQTPENTEGVVATEDAVVEGEAVAQEEVAPKKARKDMTESEKMDLCTVALIPEDRHLLHRQIEKRFLNMLEHGFLDEMHALRRSS